MGGRTNNQGFAENLIGNPLFNIGAGFLAAGGPSTTPLGVGQGLAQGLQLAQTAQQQSLRNQLVRSRLEDAARQRAASQQLGGLLGETNPLLAAAAGVAPGAVAQGVVSQQFPRQSALERRAAALGIDLRSLPENQRTQLLGGDAAGTAALDQALRAAQVQAAQQNLQTSAREERTKIGSLDANTNKALSSLTKLGDLVETTQFSGLDSAPAFASNLAKFSTTANQVAIDSALAQLNEAGGVTNAKLAAVQASKPSVQMQLAFPEVNAASVADQLETILDGARRIGAKIDQPTIEKVQNKIKSLRAFVRQREGNLSEQPQAPPQSTPPRQPRIFTPANVPPPNQRKRRDVLNLPDGRTVTWNGKKWERVE